MSFVRFDFLKKRSFRPLLLMAFVALVIAQPLSALKLPTGDSVRTVDMKLDGDAIVEVTLGTDKAYSITTPLGVVKAMKGTPVCFYKSGALKSFYPSTEHGDRTELDTSIGKLVLGESRDTLYKDQDFCCEFYESGSPKRLILYMNAVVTVGGREFGAKSGYTGNPTFVSFYDSGSKDVLQVKSLFGTKYEKDRKTVEFVTYTNKSGEFEICLTDNREMADRIDFWPDGSIKAAPLFRSPDEPAVVKGNEVYIKGGRNNRYSRYYRIYFFPDGSIREFTADDAFITEQGNIKLHVVAGRRVSLWQNGNIRLCSVSNENSFRVGEKIHTLKGKWTYKYGPPEDDYDVYLFNEDGSIRGFAARQEDWSSSFTGERMIAADVFYINGNFCRTVNVLEQYTNRRTNRRFRSEVYVDSFYNFTGNRFTSDETCIYLMEGVFPTKVFALQDGDLGANVATVQFDAGGPPVSYTLFKLDDDGDYLLDDYGVPIEDTETVKPFKK